MNEQKTYSIIPISLWKFTSVAEILSSKDADSQRPSIF